MWVPGALSESNCSCCYLCFYINSYSIAIILACLRFIDSLISKSSFLENLDDGYFFSLDYLAFLPVLELRDELDLARFFVDDFEDKARSWLLKLFLTYLNYCGKVISLVVA